MDVMYLEDIKYSCGWGMASDRWMFRPKKILDWVMRLQDLYTVLIVTRDHGRRKWVSVLRFKWQRAMYIVQRWAHSDFNSTLNQRFFSESIIFAAQLRRWAFCSVSAEAVRLQRRPSSAAAADQRLVQRERLLWRCNWPFEAVQFAAIWRGAFCSKRGPSQRCLCIWYSVTSAAGSFW